MGYSPDLCCQGPECSGATSCRACRPLPLLKEPTPKWVRLIKAEAVPPLVNGRPMTRPEHPHRYRISDEERDEALHGLRTALEEGRLSLDEHETRSEEALHAVTNTDLVPLFEDLPPKLQPASVTEKPAPEPQPGTTAPAEPGDKIDKVDTAEAKKTEKAKKPDSTVNLGALGGFGGFLLLVWGVPTIVNGSFVPIAIFLGFFCLLVVGPFTGQLVQNRKQRLQDGGDGPEQIEEG